VGFARKNQSHPATTINPLSVQGEIGSRKTRPGHPAGEEVKSYGVAKQTRCPEMMSQCPIGAGEGGVAL
jgi:hypothetical protein